MNKYRVDEALLPTDKGGFIQRWYVYRDYLPIEPINRFIHQRSLRSSATGKTYAYKLAAWLSYLLIKGKSLDDATLSDVDGFIEFVVYGIQSDVAVLSLDPKFTYSTLAGYVTVIQEYYRWYENRVDIFSPQKAKSYKSKEKARRSFLFGQIHETPIVDIIDMDNLSFKSSGYKKYWLSENEKSAILAQFRTLRDKAIFMLLLEGMRIDAALSIEIKDYDAAEETLKPSRSKGYGKEYKSEFTLVAFSDKRTAEYIDRYVATERADVEARLNDFVEPLFINLKKNTKAAGREVTYRNYWEILRTAVKRAGLNPDQISTHTGRRAKVQELLEAGATDEEIRQIMGWASSDMIDVYRNHRSKIVIKNAAKRARRRKDGNEKNKGSETS